MKDPCDRDTGRRAFLVEDDEAVRRSIQLLLHWRGYEVRSFAAAAPLLNSDNPEGAEILIADYCLPDGNGIAVLRGLREKGWVGRSVLITGYPTAELLKEAKESGFDTVLEKPLRRHELIAAIGG